MYWFKLDPITAANNVIILQLVTPRQLAEMILVIHMQLWKCTCTSNCVTHHDFLMATWTGSYQTVSVPTLQADQKKRVTPRGRFLPAYAEVMPVVIFCCLTVEATVSLSCEVTHERNLQGGTTFRGCLTLFRVWQTHCFYNINIKLMLLGNSTHEWSRKLPDMPNKTSAKCTNCRLQIIFSEEKDGREEWVKTERGRDKQRTDGLQ